MTGLLRGLAFLPAALALPALTGWAAVPVPAPADRVVTAGSASDALRQALTAEAEGDNVTRNHLLERAIDGDAHNAAARWHLGYVQSGEHWIRYEQATGSAVGQRQDRSNYLQKRATAQDTVAAQLSLAGVARESGLEDEERAHLRRAVALDWNQAEARQRLGDVRIDGFWVTHDEVAQFARELESTRVRRAAWDPAVQPIVRRLFKSQQAAWQQNWRELTAIRDPAAIPSVEAALAAGDQRGAEWYLDWLAGVDAWEASVAIARQAVLAPGADVRALAQQRLMDRSLDDYALVLVSSLRGDPVARSYVGFTPLGGLLYVEQTAVETQFDRRERTLAVVYGPEVVSLPGRPRPRHNPALRENAIALTQAVDHLRRHYRPRSGADSAEASSNIEILNDRILRAMAPQVPELALDSPRKCWDWFNEHHGLAFSGGKPLLKTEYEEFWTVDRSRQRVQQTPQRAIFVPHNCLAAGTLVVTAEGPVPIEQVQIGDRVLSQDVDTGELAFKPVLQTTASNPVPLARIVTDQGELTSTAGHPFWVNAQGWRLTRDLEPGGRVHGVDGAVEIVSVADTDRVEPAYNLVVADFHTYFAGEGRILSHDNTPRAPTNALVPGLMPDYASAEPAP